LSHSVPSKAQGQPNVTGNQSNVTGGCIVIVQGHNNTANVPPCVPPPAVLPLNKFHFEVLDQGFPGGLNLSITNPTSEEILISEINFLFPLQGVKTFGGASIDGLKATNAMVPLRFPRGETTIDFRARSVGSVPVIAYSCDPFGYGNWQMLTNIYAAVQQNPRNCRVCMKVSNVSDGEFPLCRELSCYHLGVPATLTCP
jgi:hypothetical protein